VSAILAAPAFDFLPAAFPENRDFAGRIATWGSALFFASLSGLNSRDY